MRRRQLKRLHTSKRIELDRARRSYQQRAWADAFQALVLADEQTALEPEDLERQHTSSAAMMITSEHLNVPTTLMLTPAKALVPSAARSGSAFACACAARRLAQPD